MAKDTFISKFLKLTPAEQAGWVERQTKKLLQRLPELKKNLKMYNEVSSELYNLKPEEIELISSTYSTAIKKGEVSTPTAKQAYQNFIRNLNRYTRLDIRTISKMVAHRRIEDWLKNVDQNASDFERAYVREILANMTEEQKQAFTQSKYFLDVSNWASEDFVKNVGADEMSMQGLELELFAQSRGIDTRNLYNRFVATDGKNKIRKGYRAKHK